MEYVLTGHIYVHGICKQTGDIYHICCRCKPVYIPDTIHEALMWYAVVIKIQTDLGKACEMYAHR